MKHPYADAPAYRRWSRAVAAVPPADVDPVVSMPFRISPSEQIVTAGSCFAQHIARHLRQNGFGFLVTEAAHPLVPAETAEALNYGVYSARYGNVYTARQMLQLLRRVRGQFRPADDVWERSGRYFDPFRPSIQPDGFASLREFRLDREQHFAAVLRAFQDMDVLIFTLGLTECWISRDDGAAYPVCPGTVAGDFDDRRHGFVNFSVEDVASDMTAFLEELKEINPRARTILTVSPVPLAATAEDRHVLVSTTYSKSVLRVAAEMLALRPDVAYFPSYEIVTGAFSRGSYFADDLRSITEDGVGHVMKLFFRHATTASDLPTAPVETVADDFLGEMRKVVDAICDEEKLDQD